MGKQTLHEQRLEREKQQFMRLCEWTYVPQNLEEDDDELDDSNHTDNSSNNAPMGDATNNMDNQIQDMPQDGNQDMPQDMNQDMGPNTDSNMGDDANATDAMGQESQDMPMDSMSDVGDMQDMPDIEAEDEEVIDVDDLTDAQEKMNTKVNKVGQNLGALDDKMVQLNQTLQNMINIINHNNASIEQFKQEFERRNPTPAEKMELRSLDSGPFSVSPNDYWEKQVRKPNSNYEPMSTEHEYTLTKDDVDDYNPSSIKDSFTIDDDLKQDINKIFGI